MKFGSKHKADPTFNMSSMTDVVFLLLIFFIMTSNNITPVGKKINLPNGGDGTIQIQRVAVTLAPDKSLELDNTPVTEETLLAALNDKLSPKAEDKNENVIVVRGDVENSYGDVMNIVRICSQIDNAVVTLQTEE